jgi:hypothetical protein
MLNNPKWAISRQSFIAWLETKNADEVYNWRDGEGGCLFGQYMKHLGIEWDWQTYRETGERLFGVWQGTTHANHGVAAAMPWTFGAALARTRNMPA